MVKAYRAVAKFLLRIGDLPVHILVFRLYPALFIAAALVTTIIMYAIFLVQNFMHWASITLDKIQGYLNFHM